MAVQGSVVAGIPVSLFLPNYVVKYNFGNAPDVMTWVSPDGREAGIAPFVKVPGGPIWSKAPETIFDYIERFLTPATHTPYKFELDLRGIVTININTFPIYATAGKQFVNISLTCGRLGTLVVEAERVSISGTGFAKYEFSDAITFTRYEHGEQVVPGQHNYYFDAEGDPIDNFTHGGSIDITFGGGMGGAWSGPF